LTVQAFCAAAALPAKADEPPVRRRAFPGRDHRRSVPPALAHRGGPQALEAPARPRACQRLSQLAVAQDLAAKILRNNIHSLLSQTAHAIAQLPRDRRINRTVAVTAMRPLLPLLLLGRATAQQLADALDLLARRTYAHRPAKTRPRPTRPKPHKFMAVKAC